MTGLADDPTIGDDSNLWRRIPPFQWIFDDNLGRKRISTAAFNDPELSVILGDELLTAGRGSREALAGFDDFGVASITAGLARTCNQIVCRDATLQEPSHALVIGKKTKSIQKKLVSNAMWVIPLED